MKRGDVICHLERHGCVFLREGSGHTIYWNPQKGTSTSVPRHEEIVNHLVRKICKQLKIRHPW